MFAFCSLLLNEIILMMVSWGWRISLFYLDRSPAFKDRWPVWNSWCNTCLICSVSCAEWRDIFIKQTPMMNMTWMMSNEWFCLRIMLQYYSVVLQWHSLQYDEIYQIGWVNYYRKRQSLVVDVWIKSKTFLIFKLSIQHVDIKVIVSIVFADSYKAYIVHSWLWIKLFQCPNYAYTAFNKNLLNSRSDSSVTFVFSCASCCCR